MIKEAQMALQEGNAVVIGLQSTGEAAADATGLQPGQACSFVSTTQELLLRFVATHFPTKYNPTEAESEPLILHQRLYLFYTRSSISYKFQAISG